MKGKKKAGHHHCMTGACGGRGLATLLGKLAGVGFDALALLEELGQSRGGTALSQHLVRGRTGCNDKEVGGCPKRRLKTGTQSGSIPPILRYNKSPSFYLRYVNTHISYIPR